MSRTRYLCEEKVISWSHQNNLELMKGSEFFFDYIHSYIDKCHKINPNCRGSYIGSPDWIKNEKATITPINNKDNKCFQYAATVTLNHGDIGTNSEKITKIKRLLNKYNWEEIKPPSEKVD